MHLDKNGLPVQADGDANDQLQRVGSIVTAATLARAPSALVHTCAVALETLLQPADGVYVRHPGGDPQNVSADQLIAALGAQVAQGNKRAVWNMFKAMARRLGFAQNTRDGLGAGTRWKLPDFMALRAAPLLARTHWALWPLALLADSYLVALVVGDWYYVRTDKDPADCNNTVLTLAVCRAVKPTPLSIAACHLARLLQLNFVERLARYHRAESGGNPEIAEMWRPICEEFLR